MHALRRLRTRESRRRKFCSACGARLTAASTACGASNEPGEKCCGECGVSLVAAAPKAPQARTPKHLADKILMGKSVLEGERKQVTVLFADVKDSMDLAEGMDPEAWSAIMQRFFTILPPRPAF